MPKKQLSEIRLYCVKWTNYTQSIELINIKKDIGSRFHIKAMCLICNKYKTKFLSQKQVKLLLDEIKNSVDGWTFTNIIERNGGFLSIIPLIAAVAAEISALASAGGVTACAIISAKNSAEETRHHYELENIAKNSGQSDSVNILKNHNNLQTIVKFNIAVLPNIIKTLPETANKIKHSINSERIKIDEPNVLSDDKLIDQSIEFLRGKGYDVSM